MRANALRDANRRELRKQRGRHRPSTGVGQVLTPLGAQRGLRWAAATQPREHKLGSGASSRAWGRVLGNGGHRSGCRSQQLGVQTGLLGGEKRKKRAK